VKTVQNKGCVEEASDESGIEGTTENGLCICFIFVTLLIQKHITYACSTHCGTHANMHSHAHIHAHTHTNYTYHGTHTYTHTQASRMSVEHYDATLSLKENS